MIKKIFFTIILTSNLFTNDWSSPTSLDSISTSDLSIDIAQEENYVLTSWIDFDGTNYILKCKYSNDKGKTWSDLKNLSTLPNEKYKARVSISGNNALIAYSCIEDSTYKIKVNKIDILELVVVYNSFCKK